MPKTQLPENFLLINKPRGWTSFDAVNFIRKKMISEGAQKNIRVGHSGTLDPFATGLLIVGVGREATKKLDKFKNLRKTYVATVRLGAASDTGDLTGIITPTIKPLDPRLRLPAGRHGGDDNVTLDNTLKSFLGPQLQTPPMYSAKKINGKKLYELARKGKTMERQPVPIKIYDIKLLDYVWPNLKIEVTCSAGTYIRVLAEDIGKKLGCGAYCQELMRTKIGEYNLDNAVTPDKINI